MTEKGSAFLDLMGGEVFRDGSQGVKIRLTIEPHHTNPRGVMHGGVVASLLDEAAALAIKELLGLRPQDSGPHLLVEMNVSFLAAARPGDTLEAEASVLRMGRRVAFAEAQVHRGKTLIAKGRFTFVMQHD